MNQFFYILRQTELDLERTNNLKNIDFFQISENFILESLRALTPDLTRANFHKYLLALKNYLQLTLPPKYKILN